MDGLKKETIVFVIEASNQVSSPKNWMLSWCIVSPTDGRLYFILFAMKTETQTGSLCFRIVNHKKVS